MDFSGINVFELLKSFLMSRYFDFPTKPQAPNFMYQYDLERQMTQSMLMNSMSQRMDINPLGMSLAAKMMHGIGLTNVNPILYNYSSGGLTDIGNVINMALNKLLGQLGAQAVPNMGANLYGATFGLTSPGIGYNTNEISALTTSIMRGLYRNPDAMQGQMTPFIPQDSLAMLSYARQLGMLSNVTSPQDIAGRLVKFSGLTQNVMQNFGIEKKEEAMQMLLNLSGGTVNLDNPQAMHDLLNKAKSLGEVSTIAMDVIKAVLEAGANLAREANQLTITGGNITVGALQQAKIVSMLPSGLKLGPNLSDAQSTEFFARRELSAYNSSYGQQISGMANALTAFGKFEGSKLQEAISSGKPYTEELKQQDLTRMGGNPAIGAYIRTGAKEGAAIISGINPTYFNAMNIDQEYALFKSSTSYTAGASPQDEARQFMDYITPGMMRQGLSREGIAELVEREFPRLNDKLRPDFEAKTKALALASETDKRRRAFNEIGRNYSSGNLLQALSSYLVSGNFKDSLAIFTGLPVNALGGNSIDIMDILYNRESNRDFAKAYEEVAVAYGAMPSSLAEYMDWGQSLQYSGATTSEENKAKMELVLSQTPWQGIKKGLQDLSGLDISTPEKISYMMKRQKISPIDLVKGISVSDRFEGPYRGTLTNAYWDMEKAGNLSKMSTVMKSYLSQLTGKDINLPVETMLGIAEIIQKNPNIGQIPLSYPVIFDKTYFFAAKNPYLKSVPEEELASIATKNGLSLSKLKKALNDPNLNSYVVNAQRMDEEAIETKLALLIGDKDITLNDALQQAYNLTESNENRGHRQNAVLSVLRKFKVSNSEDAERNLRQALGVGFMPKLSFEQIKTNIFSDKELATIGGSAKSLPELITKFKDAGREDVVNRINALSDPFAYTIKMNELIGDVKQAQEAASAKEKQANAEAWQSYLYSDLGAFTRTSNPKKIEQKILQDIEAKYSAGGTNLTPEDLSKISAVERVMADKMVSYKAVSSTFSPAFAFMQAAQESGIMSVGEAQRLYYKLSANKESLTGEARNLFRETSATGMVTKPLNLDIANKGKMLEEFNKLSSIDKLALLSTNQEDLAKVLQRISPEITDSNEVARLMIRGDADAISRLPGGVGARAAAYRNFAIADPDISLKAYGTIDQKIEKFVTDALDIPKKIIEFFDKTLPDIMKVISGLKDSTFFKWIT